MTYKSGHAHFPSFSRGSSDFHFPWKHVVNTWLFWWVSSSFWTAADNIVFALDGLLMFWGNLRTRQQIQTCNLSLITVNENWIWPLSSNIHENTSNGRRRTSWEVVNLSEQPCPVLSCSKVCVLIGYRKRVWVTLIICETPIGEDILLHMGVIIRL
jgi:hypothetical protein